jgi:hypothetical protein
MMAIRSSIEFGYCCELKKARRTASERRRRKLLLTPASFIACFPPGAFSSRRPVVPDRDGCGLSGKLDSGGRYFGIESREFFTNQCKKRYASVAIFVTLR